MTPFLLLLAAAVAAGFSMRPEPPDALGRLLPAAEGSPPLRAYLVFQLADCRGNLAFLDVLDRPDLAGRIAAEGLLLDGSGKLSDARGYLERARRPMPLRAVSPRLGRSLTTLGHRRTPYVVVLDRDGIVRLTAGVPANWDERVVLARLLTAISRPTRSESAIQ